MENGRPPDPADWAVTDVVNYFRTAGFEEQANAFQEQVTQAEEAQDDSSLLPHTEKGPESSEGAERHLDSKEEQEESGSWGPSYKRKASRWSTAERGSLSSSPSEPSEGHAHRQKVQSCLHHRHGGKQGAGKRQTDKLWRDTQPSPQQLAPVPKGLLSPSHLLCRCSSRWSLGYRVKFRCVCV